MLTHEITQGNVPKDMATLWRDIELANNATSIQDKAHKKYLYGVLTGTYEMNKVRFRYAYQYLKHNKNLSLIK